jgi:YggT family protein
MLNALIYPVVQTLIIALVMIIVFLMVIRLIFNYTDPNPFGTIGKFSYNLKKFTDRIVHPSASFLARVGIDTRIAPLVTVLVFCIFGYFTLQLFSTVLSTIDGVTMSLAAGNLVRLVGFLLYGFLGLFSLAVIMRVIFSWFMSYTNPLMRFLMRVTDPILVPFRRLLPPIMMFDISPIIVIFILQFLQTAVRAVLLT